jgi:hypothetical protein
MHDAGESCTRGRKNFSVGMAQLGVAHFEHKRMGQTGAVVG